MDESASIALWQQFTECVGAAEDVLRWPGVDLDDLDRAEGLRYLARLLSVGVQSQLGPRSTRHPDFQVLSNGFGIDNPDNRYLGTPVDADLDYVIRGRLTNLAYLSFAAQNQNFSRTDATTGGGAHIQGHELVTDDDGRFELVASRQRQGPNWLPFEADTNLLLVRQTRADLTEQWMDLEVECVQVDEPAPPLGPESVGDRLAMAGLFAAGAGAWFKEWVSPWFEQPNSFRLADPDQQRLIGGDPNILSQSGYWTLGPDEMLEILIQVPACAYWNVQLANVWAECLDTRRQISLNHRSAHVDGDVVRVLVAHEDPGTPNWLDTAGHRHGLMHIRFVNSDGSPLAATRVLRATTPAGDRRDDVD
jgi:hypothetical protein